MIVPPLAPLRPAVLFCLIALAGCGSRPDPKPPIGDGASEDAPTVVVLSLDGFRHDYPEKAPTPNIDRIATEGVRVKRLIPPFPSQTFVGHATLATGVSPDRHGMLNNKYWSRSRGAYNMDDDVTWYDRAPLWIHAQGHGIRTHVYHWVGSAGAYEGVEPAFWRHFDKSITDDNKINTIIGWLNEPGETRPGLVMSYLHGCDHAGHIHGPDSPEVESCVRDTDARLGRLMTAIEGLAHPTTLLVVSDHGMMKTRGNLDIERAIHLVDAEARVIAVGPVAHVYFGEGDVTDARLERIQATIQGLSAQAEGEITTYRRGHVPKALRNDHPDRVGDLMLVAPFGYRFSGTSIAGHHGHDPTRPEMGAIFFAWGSGASPGGQVALARSIDLYPVVCQLLGLPIDEEIEGAAPPGMLKTGAKSKTHP